MKEGGRRKEKERMDRKGKWKKKGEERKGDKNTYLGCYSCNSAEK